MNKIIVALFAATLSTAAFASEARHNDQSIRDVAVEVQSNAGFGLSQGTLLTEAANTVIGAERGAFSGK